MEQGPNWTANSSLTLLKYFMPLKCKAPVHNSPIPNPLLRKLNIMSVFEDKEKSSSYSFRVHFDSKLHHPIRLMTFN